MKYLQTGKLKYRDPELYYRLIALWVLCEAMLGGVIHGLRIPVSGLIVGSSAVICISLIAWYVPQKGAILKATIVVAIFKMMLSPHASFPAYIAVLFQGALGEILFWKRNHYRLSCFILAVLALLESGLQRILVLTIIYGNDLWVVINDFVNGLTKQVRRTNYSMWIVSVYVGLHLVTGIIIGWFTGSLPARINKLKDREEWKLQGAIHGEEVGMLSKRRKKRKLWLWSIWAVLTVLYFQSEFSVGTPLLPSNLIIGILLRSFIIVVSWILIVSPLLNQVLHNWLTKKQVKWKDEVMAVNSILPSMRSLVTASWKLSGANKRLARLRVFTGILLVNMLRSKTNVYILSSAIQSGKTSSLLRWKKVQKEVSGILTPVRDGKRYFMDIFTGEEFRMEADENEKENISIGRFRFSTKNFSRAIQVLKRDLNKKGWLVVDEIGPLELKGEGFAEILKEIIAERSGNILLVVREGLVDNVVKQFRIMSYETVTEPPIQDI